MGRKKKRRIVVSLQQIRAMSQQPEPAATTKPESTTVKMSSLEKLRQMFRGLNDKP